MLKIGHRGASGHAPENTLAAFEKALALGADGVELDVHRLKTGELAVIHDDTLDRTTNGKGRVADLTREQLKSLRTREGERIPLLDEVPRALKGAYCFIETKHEDAALPAASLIERAIKAGYGKERLWLISFRHEALKAALKAFPTLYAGASFERLGPDSIREAHATGMKAVMPHFGAVSAGHVEEAHVLGLKVICWTVNAPVDIARLKGMGVDGIISDYPERL